MNRRWGISFALVTFLFASHAQGESLLLRGYLPSGQSYRHAYVAIEDKRITGVSTERPSGSFDHELATEDAIYPSLINLHNHTKYNILPLWKEARGQFENRFEWRAWTPYKKTVSENLNPWIKEKEASCAAFRFSEIEAMVEGTSHLQGASSCTSNFTIHAVEDADAFDGARAPVQGVTDIVIPDHLGKVFYPEIFPLMNPQEWLRWRSDRSAPIPGTDYLKAFDTWRPEPGISAHKNYIEMQHKPIVSKLKYLARQDLAGVITHLSEGRRNDPYNRYEFDLLVQLGLDRPGMNLIHGVGLGYAEWNHLASRGVGLIWSPFSNLLLYNETADILAAHRAGVTIALGSDWAPTGSRSVLGELKIAKRYVKKMGLEATFTDEYLVRMVTSNPAKMLHLSDVTGEIAKGKLADLVLVKVRSQNPYTNLIEAESRDIQLLVVDGRPLYGEPDYLERTGRLGYEVLPASANSCGFKKALVAQKTKEMPSLDTFEAIDRYLTEAMTKKKAEREAAGAGKYAVDPPKLYACDDADYTKRFDQFIEVELDRNGAARSALRAQLKLGSVPEKLAEMFGLRGEKR